jgi:hypothetical protein
MPYLISVTEDLASKVDTTPVVVCQDAALAQQMVMAANAEINRISRALGLLAHGLRYADGKAHSVPTTDDHPDVTIPADFGPLTPLRPQDDVGCPGVVPPLLLL